MTTKSRIVETVGFGKFQGRAKVTFPITSENDILDLQLGLKSKIKASRFTFTSERFGIKAGKPELDLRDVELDVRPGGRDGMMRFQFLKGPTITVPAKVFHAEHGKRHAVRVTTRCFEWIWESTDQVRVRASMNDADRIPLDDLAIFAHLKASGGAPVLLECDLDDRSLDCGSITLDPDEQKQAWEWSALGLATLRDIRKEVSVPFPEFVFHEVSEASARLNIMSALASEHGIRFDFFPTRAAPKHFRAFLAFAHAVVGDTVYAVVVTRPIVEDRPARKGGKRRIWLGPGRMLKALTCPTDRWDGKLIFDAYQRQLDQLAVDGEILAIGDLYAAVDGGVDHLFSVDLPTKRSKPAKRLQQTK